MHRCVCTTFPFGYTLNSFSPNFFLHTSHLLPSFKWKARLYLSASSFYAFTTSIFVKPFFTFNSALSYILLLNALFKNGSNV